jgi:hypothetical protein
VFTGADSPSSTVGTGAILLHDGSQQLDVVVVMISVDRNVIYEQWIHGQLDDAFFLVATENCEGPSPASREVKVQQVFSLFP